MQGACQRHELCDLTVDDIQDKDDVLLVKIPKTKTSRLRSFVVTDKFYHIHKKYADSLPPNLASTRFFVNYRGGKVQHKTSVSTPVVVCRRPSQRI